METPYRAMSFTKHDVLTKDDMDQMQNNLRWIQENTPRGRFYRENGTAQDVRLVMICGRVGIGKSKKDTTVRKPVRFGRAFAPKCRPRIQTGIVSAGRRDIFVVANGPGGRELPDATGFEIVVNVPDDNRADKWKIKNPFFVFWQAHGYRTDDMNEF